MQATKNEAKRDTKPSGIGANRYQHKSAFARHHRERCDHARPGITVLSKKVPPRAWRKIAMALGGVDAATSGGGRVDRDDGSTRGSDPNNRNGAAW
jgi:hypothetical protein